MKLMCRTMKSRVEVSMHNKADITRTRYSGLLCMNERSSGCAI